MLTTLAQEAGMTSKRRTDPSSRKLFRTSDQTNFLEEPSLEEALAEMPIDGASGPKRAASRSKTCSVECLGLTFESDEARRAYFLERLQEKLKDPEFRKIEGFPVGEDEDILRLSDPPYYTACPNPFIEDFVRCYGKPFDAGQPYTREPFAADVSEGKSDSIYNAHSYHTKVPHKAIMRYILHYTQPGDIVLDGFCGTGMTGVAAHLCGNRQEVSDLGYAIHDDGTLVDSAGNRVSHFGPRFAILADLSPAATFIAYNYNVPVSISAFAAAARRLLSDFEDRYGWMYRTMHTDGRTTGRINYVVWSDIFLCSNCQQEIIFWVDAVDEGDVKDQIQCPECGTILSRRTIQRARTTVLDPTLGRPIAKAKRVPVLIDYRIGSVRFQKKPDDADREVLRRIDQEAVPGWYPRRRIDEDIDLWYERDYRALGIFSVDAFFSKRSLIAASFFHDSIAQSEGRLSAFLWFWFESVLMGFTMLNRFLKNAFSQVNRILSGTLYVGAMQSEVSPWYALEGKIHRLRALERLNGANQIIATMSTSALDLPENSVDYVFVDPPFGSNIIYSDLSILWESWLRLWTRTSAEAVVHRRKKNNPSTLENYGRLMTACFARMHRALKPNRWITIEFHNSRNSVWNTMQEALLRAGFVVADVRVLDKQLETFKQVTAAGAVKQDLVISAYKPAVTLEKRFTPGAGSEEGVWDFTRSHLRQLPVFVRDKDGRAEVVLERLSYLLFDRMVAFHVQRGVLVPMSAAEFYAGLKERFPERDGMFFLPDQVAEYDRKRLTVKEVFQLELAPTDEATAIQWLRQQLERKPQTFQELHPEFLKAIAGWERHEKPLELRDLLAQNFLRYDGEGPIPEPIWAWMQRSSTLREMMKGRDREDPGPLLRAEAADRWYVPDPSKAHDLERLREKALLKEFDDYRAFKGKQMKLFRLEAVRVGFKRAWQERDYATIMAVARKIPDAVLQEDPKLLMWYDQALTRSGEGS